MLDFLVVDFFAELFFDELFFLAMALSPPFVCANLRVAKIKVNVFLRPRRFFLDALIVLALPRARRFARASRAELARNRALFSASRAPARSRRRRFSAEAQRTRRKKLNLKF